MRGLVYHRVSQIRTKPSCTLREYLLRMRCMRPVSKTTAAYKDSMYRAAKLYACADVTGSTSQLCDTFRIDLRMA
jgi:hypothetical protein